MSYTSGVMAKLLGLAAEAVPTGTIFITWSILLVPIVLASCLGWSALHSRQREQITTWLVWRGFGRFVLAATVAGWWVTWNLGGRSEMPAALTRKFPGAFDPSNLEALLFWLPPVVSLAVFLVTCYAVDRTVLKQRWSFAALLRRAWWRLASFVIPLLMVASGFTLIFSGKIVGTVWLITAGIISRVGTAFLRRAEGMKFNRLKSGELRNRALKMADHMGVTISRVYIVPAGKGHLTNAYSLSNAIGLTDSLGQHLTKTQMDYVMAHELAHVKLRHGRKDLLFVLAIYSALTLVLFRFSQHAMALQPLAEFTVIVGSLVAVYYLSRRFEYAADAFAVDFSGDPEAAIRALVNLHKIHEVPAQCNRLTELFMTHPPLARRAAAIAKAGGMAKERLDRILSDEGVVFRLFGSQVEKGNPS
jgi:Zn-dependent protease with chaperone function